MHKTDVSNGRLIMEKKVFIVSVFLIGVVVLSGILGKQNIRSETLKTAPEFSLPAVNDGTIKLGNYRGSVVILDFWATWCPPCKDEIPDFIKLYNNYKDKGLMIIGISLDTDTDKLKDFCRNMGINYPIAMSDDKVTGAYGGIQYIPTTFIIDKEGNIVKKYVGFTKYSEFESQIKKLLESK